MSVCGRMSGWFDSSSRSAVGTECFWTSAGFVPYSAWDTLVSRSTIAGRALAAAP